MMAPNARFRTSLRPFAMPFERSDLWASSLLAFAHGNIHFINGRSSEMPRAPLFIIFRMHEAEACVNLAFVVVLLCQAHRGFCESVIIDHVCHGYAMCVEVFIIEFMRIMQTQRKFLRERFHSVLITSISCPARIFQRPTFSVDTR